MEKTRNHAFDVLKGIACIGVVFIHVKFLGLTGDIVSKISQFAVPIFFMIAGYYAFNSDIFVIKRRLIKIIKILLYSLLLYSSFYFITHIIKCNFEEWILNLFTLKNLLKSIVFCTIGFAIPLWYLIAMAETYILWYFVVKNKNEINLVKLLPLIFFIRFFLTSYVESKGLPWCLKINFITCSLTWFLLGYYVKLKENIIYNIKNKMLFITLISGVIIALIPILFNTNINFSNIGLFFYSLSLFLFAIKYKNIQINNIITYIGNKLSLNIYILHSLIAVLLHYANVLQFHINNSFVLHIKPIIVLIITILTAYIIEIIVNLKDKIYQNKF